MEREVFQRVTKEWEERVAAGQHPRVRVQLGNGESFEATDMTTWVHDGKASSYARFTTEDEAAEYVPLEFVVRVTIWPAERPLGFTATVESDRPPPPAGPQAT